MRLKPRHSCLVRLESVQPSSQAIAYFFDVEYTNHKQYLDFTLSSVTIELSHLPLNVTRSVVALQSGNEGEVLSYVEYGEELPSCGRLVNLMKLRLSQWALWIEILKCTNKDAEGAAIAYPVVDTRQLYFVKLSVSGSGTPE